MQPDYNFDGSSKRLLWLIGIGTTIALVVIATLLVVFLRKQGRDDQAKQQAAAVLSIGQYPYVYPCSVATIANYESAFGLNDGGTIGYQYENSAFTNARGDLMQTATQPDPSAGYSSSCSMSMPKSPSAAAEVSATVTIMQFASTKGPNDSLSRDRLSASAASTNPNASAPALPSFTTDSVYIKPSTLNNSIEGSVAHNNLYITVEYGLQDGDTAATALPKLDTFMKTIVANADNKAIATKPNSLAGHSTFLNTPFVDVCKSLDFTKLANTFDGVQFRPDSMTIDSQYGAPAGLAAATNGVVSNCGLTFNTATDRAGFQAFNKSAEARALQLVNIYPQALRLSMNTYANADAAKAAWNAKKAAATPTTLGPALQTVNGLGDAAYNYHSQSIFQKSATNQAAGPHQVNYTLVQDDHVILSGNHVITISFQQNSEADPYTTGPVPITMPQIQSTFQLFKDVLAKSQPS